MSLTEPAFSEFDGSDPPLSRWRRHDGPGDSGGNAGGQRRLDHAQRQSSPPRPTSSTSTRAYAILREPSARLSDIFPVRMDDGSVEVFAATGSSTT